MLVLPRCCAGKGTTEGCFCDNKLAEVHHEDKLQSHRVTTGVLWDIVEYNIKKKSLFLYIYILYIYHVRLPKDKALSYNLSSSSSYLLFKRCYPIIKHSGYINNISWLCVA